MAARDRDVATLSPPRWRRALRAAARLVARVGAIVILTLLLLEFFFRVAYPTPPVQVIRAEGTGLRVVRGVPVWSDGDTPARVNGTCATRWPDAARVVFAGSSISFGSGVEAHEAFPARIQERLDDLLGPGRVCVHNLAQPGYGFLNKLVVLEDHVARAAAHLVVWEVWGTDLHDHTLIGDSAYALRDLRTDAAGYPRGPVTHAGVHHTLFTRSRAYEYTSLVLAARGRRPSVTPPERFARIARVRELCARVGATLVLLFAPTLDRPFREQLGHGRRDILMHAARWARDAGVDVVPLADVLVAEDYRSLRRDPCCHYNPVGHARIADGLLAHPVLGPLLRAPAGAPGEGARP